MHIDRPVLGLFKDNKITSPLKDIREATREHHNDMKFITA